MRLSTLITNANEILEKHGDLTVGIEFIRDANHIDLSHALHLKVDGQAVILSNGITQGNTEI